MSKYISIFLIGLILSIQGMSCASVSSKGTSIQGKFSDASDLRIYLDKVLIVQNKIETIAQTDIKSNGKFSFNTDQPLEPGIYRLRIGIRSLPLILDEGQRSIQINGSLAGVDNGTCTIKGSDESMRAHQVMGKLFNKEIGVAEFKQEVIKSENPLAGMFYAFRGLSATKEDTEIIKGIVEKMRAKYPKSSYTADLDNFATTMERNIMAQENAQVVKEGVEAPNIAMPNPEGKVIELKSLRGKVVLLDFWASWCGPCRRENPNVVNLYNKYKDKGFTVYSVSLDRPGAVENWKEAIAADHLSWPNHVSDLQHWNSAAGKLYGVESIPRTFLLNKEGMIVATNLRGEALEPAIKKYL